MRQTTTAEVRHDEGKATSFMRHEAETHRFRCLRHPSRLGLFAMEAQNQTVALACPAIRGKNFFLSVNYLTLLDQFLNDAA
jgi:hypothetical protein